MKTTIGSWVLSSAALALAAAALVIALRPRETPGPQADRSPRPQPATVAAGGDMARQLVETTREGFDTARQQARMGAGDNAEAAEWSARWLQAELATGGDRAAAVDAHIQRIQELADVVRKQFDRGLVRRSAVLDMDYRLLEARRLGTH